jgi:hypothetical protein
MKYEHGFIIKINWEMPLQEGKFKPHIEPASFDIPNENQNLQKLTKEGYRLMGYIEVNDISRSVWIHTSDILNLFWKGSDYMDATLKEKKHSDYGK